LYDPGALCAEDLVEAGGELRVPVPDQEPNRMGARGEQQAQIAGLLRHPLAHWVSGHPREVGPPGADLDEEQYVEALEQHRVDGEEIAGEHYMCLCSQELGPSRAGPPRRRLDPMTAKDVPHTRGRDLDAHPGQLSLDAPVAPHRVLPGQAKYDRDGARRYRWSPRPSARVRPSPSHQVSVPSQERLRPDKQTTSASLGKEPAQPHQDGQD